MIDINELRKLAQAATPGPWEVYGLDQHGQAIIKGEHIEIATCWHHCVESIEKEMHANAALIAAANPAAIIELLDRLEAAEKERDRYKLAYNDCIAKTEWLHRADAVKLEIDRLRAEIEEVKKREREACTKICDDGWNTAAMGILAAGIRARGEENEKKLYTIPGAQQGE